MTEYVLIYSQRYNRESKGGIIEVLFILKDRPAWQAGKLNLPGGKIEPGETPEQAAIRELKEETGMVPFLPPRYCGHMEAKDSKIHIIELCIHQDETISPREGETEKPMWLIWGDAKIDSRMIPNLRVIVPLCMCGVEGWVIHDEAKCEYHGPHTLSVSVPTGC